MTFDELQDEYIKLTREIFEETSKRWTNPFEQSEKEIYLMRLKLRFDCVTTLLDQLSGRCDDHHQELLDEIFPPKN